jgi:hypothetical protein
VAAEAEEYTMRGVLEALVELAGKTATAVSAHP